jgi:hypothetical protein
MNDVVTMKEIRAVFEVLDELRSPASINDPAHARASAGNAPSEREVRDR